MISMVFLVAEHQRWKMHFHTEEHVLHWYSIWYWQMPTELSDTEQVFRYPTHSLLCGHRFGKTWQSVIHNAKVIFWGLLILKTSARKPKSEVKSFLWGCLLQTIKEWVENHVGKHLFSQWKFLQFCNNRNLFCPLRTPENLMWQLVFPFLVV